MQVGGTTDVEIMLEGLIDAHTPSGNRPAGYARAGLPCFNHPLYKRDPRAATLLDLVAGFEQPRPETRVILDFIEGTEMTSGQYPNVFAALVVAARALGLPDGSAAFLHTVGRTSGWLAHAVEQRLAGAMLRPRAKYMSALGDNA
jgi:citrate synthase